MYLHLQQALCLKKQSAANKLKFWLRSAPLQRGVDFYFAKILNLCESIGVCVEYKAAKCRNIGEVELIIIFIDKHDNCGGRRCRKRRDARI